MKMQPISNHHIYHTVLLLHQAPLISNNIKNVTQTTSYCHKFLFNYWTVSRSKLSYMDMHGFEPASSGFLQDKLCDAQATEVEKRNIHIVFLDQIWKGIYPVSSSTYQHLLTTIQQMLSGDITYASAYVKCSPSISPPLSHSTITTATAMATGLPRSRTVEWEDNVIVIEATNVDGLEKPKAAGCLIVTIMEQEESKERKKRGHQLNSDSYK